MPTVISGDELAKAVADETFIRHGDLRCAEGIKYDLRLGPQLLRAGRNPMKIGELPETGRSQLCLDPGEMAFVLTAETLDLPADMIAMLSPKRNSVTKEYLS
jgi:deoxycytidine triphosphate deaminase